jgi:hypothetical protein
MEWERSHLWTWPMLCEVARRVNGVDRTGFTYGSFAPAAPARPVRFWGLPPPDPRFGPERASSSIAGRAGYLSPGRENSAPPAFEERGVGGRAPEDETGRVGAAGRGTACSAG